MASQASERPDLRANATQARLSLPSPALLVVALALGVYLLTLAPTVFLLDSAELTLAAYTLGLAHSPGYPVYLLLLRLFLFLPLGDVGYSANLFSALANALSAGLVALLVRRLCRRWAPAAIAALCFAFSLFTWSVAVVAEVYTFQGLLLAGMLLLLVHWREGGRAGALYGAAALFGLALANTPAALLWAPGLAVLALATPRRRLLTPRRLAALGAAALLALTPLLYLPWRSAARPAFVNVGFYDAQATFHPLSLTSPGALVAYLSGQQFAGLFFGGLSAGPGAAAAEFLVWLVWAFLGVGLPLGLLGAWILWRREAGLGAGLALTPLPYALFFISYGAADKAVMFLPLYLVWAVLLGVGAAALFEEFPPRLAGLLALLPLALLVLNWPAVSLREAWGPAEQARRRLELTPPDTLFLALWGEAETMRYLQLVEGVRPDVLVVNRFFVPPEQQQPLIDAALRRRPVYATFHDLALAVEYRFVPLEDAYRLHPLP